MRTSTIFVLLFLSLFSICCLHNQENNKLYSNLNDFASGSCYIYVDVKFKNDIYTIVIPNNSLYRNLKHQLFSGTLSEADYTNLISRVIKDKSYIEINEGLDTLLRGRSLRKDLVAKYEKIDILNKHYVLTNGTLPDSIDYENRKAIIYTLLKKGIKNCCQNCETGKTIIF